MDIRQSIEDLQRQQQLLSKEYERVLQEVQSLDLLQENKMLRQELDKKIKLCNELEQQLQRITTENQELKISLQEQIFDEKMNILKLSRRKLNTYFNHTVREHENRLTIAESEAMREINKLKKVSAQQLSEELAPILAELKSFENLMQEKIRQNHEEFDQQITGAAAAFNNQLDELCQQEITEEVLQKRIKQNQLEMKIGLNWINRLGILLIIFGVGTAAKYSYSTWFTDYMKGAFIFLLGGLLVAGGEWFYRKGKETFAAGLLGGGISVLYCGTFYSYFLLKIISLYSGMILSILVTVAAVTFAVRYQSAVICALGLVGGYLPFYSYISTFGLMGNAYYVAMGYLFLLNLAIMVVSFQQKWNKVSYISMILHIPSLVYLILGASNPIISILYTIASFSTYVGVALAYLLHDRQLVKQDVVFLGFNTLFSCVILYGLFSKAGWADYYGLLALGFCSIYAGLARFIEQKIPGEKYTLLLFYTTAVTFAILMIPFQLGVRWVSMGWLVEGVLFIIYGLRNNEIRLEKSGLLIFALCILSFYLLDGSNYFEIKYFLIVASMVLVTGVYLVDLKNHGIYRYGRYWKMIHWFKYFSLINLWYYLIYSSGKVVSYFMSEDFYTSFYRLILAAAITIVVAYVLPRIPLLQDQKTPYCSLGFYGIAIFMVLHLNLMMPVLRNLPVTSFAEYGALVVLIFFNVLLLFIFREIIPVFLKQHYWNFEFYPLFMLVFLFGDISLFLAAQFRLASTNLFFSLSYLCMALGAILYGFRHQYAYVRRAGLGLSLFATTKLFIFDLAFLTAFYKILAYFCFGTVLLGISYLYQRLKTSREESHHGNEI